MMVIVDEILAFVKRMHPTGRAFKIAEGSNIEKLHRAFSVSGARAFNDAYSILDSALPDNLNFSVDDATLWEGRLGLITNSALSLATRKLAIKRKMNHPGTVKARNNYLFLQKQLRDAGFDVYVYLNKFDDGMGGYITKSPEEITGMADAIQFGDVQLGDAQFGGGLNNIVVNYIDEDSDSVFNVGSNLRSTFFIGGSPIGEFADVDITRKDEFRQLILKTKPVQTVTYLFINYV